MTESPTRAPKFEVHGTVARPEMTPEQRAFYEQDYRPSVEAGCPLDADDGYSVVMLHELIELFGSQPESAIHAMRRLAAAHTDSSLLAPDNALADMHFVRGEWAEGLKHVRGQRRLVVALGVGSLLHPRADPADVLLWGTPSVTKAGFQHFGAAGDDLVAVLDAFHDEHGVSMVEDFWTRLNADEPLHIIAAGIQPELRFDYSTERIAELIDFGRSYPPLELTAFDGFAGYERPLDAPWPWPNLFAYRGLFRAFFRRLFRESENRARESAGLPRVGEGLVSEVRLLNQLRAAFPEERIVHQARPAFLGAQSLDILFIDRDVAVEYQGLQHAQPVDYFGGSLAFERQQERDARKRSLCDLNGVVLIEVLPHYKLDAVVAEVREALDAQAQRARGAGPSPS